MIIVNKLQIDRPRFQSNSLKAYIVAGLIIAGAAVLQLLLKPWIESMPFIAFFPAVIITSFLCGSSAGILAALLSILAAWLFILPSGLSPLLLRNTPIFGVGALTVAAVIGVMRAATDNVRRLNETLRVSEGQFRGLLESAPDAMVIVDEQRGISLINAQTESMFGYHREELLGRSIEMLVSERDHKFYLERCAAFVIDPQTAPADRVIDLYGRRRDGTEFPIEISLGLLKTETGILVSNAIRDITARRQIEANLEKASKAKSDFLASVSHELRTPLNAIIGFSEMIRDAILGPLDVRYREYGSDINKSGRHLHNIINDILDISKIESGHFELRDEIVSIGEVVDACSRIVASMADAGHVALTVDVPSALPPIRSDRVRFQQILLNLMSNAVKFTNAGGSVTVSAAVEADGLTVTVADTGIGMKAEDIAIALEPFRQIDGPLSRRFEGTGLGLPLARALVELHGGRLEIKSAPTVGTVVRIRLPLERMTHAA